MCFVCLVVIRTIRGTGSGSTAGSTASTTGCSGSTRTSGSVSTGAEDSTSGSTGASVTTSASTTGGSSSTTGWRTIVSISSPMPYSAGSGGRLYSSYDSELTELDGIESEDIDDELGSDEYAYDEAGSLALYCSNCFLFPLLFKAIFN